MVAAFAYRDGQRVAGIQRGESGAGAVDRDVFVWIGFHEPTEQDLRTLQRQFGLPPLAVEDALTAHQMRKLEVYADSLFVVLRAAALEAGEIVFGEPHVFAGRSDIITVRHGPSLSYTAVRERCESNPHKLRHGVDDVLHGIVDVVVDNYLPVIDALAEAADAIDQRIAQGRLSPEDIRRV